MVCRLLPVRRNFRHITLAAVASLLLAGCATMVPPVEVTRFHSPALANLAPGTAYRFAETDPTSTRSNEVASYRLAVDGELQRLGFVEAKGNVAAPLLVRLSMTRSERTAAGASPVSVGVGGSTGSYGSGVGLGLGINLGGGPRQWTDLSLEVRIDDAASKTALWEGRALSSVPSKAPAAQSSLAAAKLAAALFKGFPGESGRTISVP